MRIDSHQHFWHYKAQSYPWISDAVPMLKRDYLPRELKPQLDQAHMEGTVVVQARQVDAENAYLLDMCGEFPWIRGVVGWVDMTSPQGEDQIRRHARHPRFKGIRYGFSPNWTELESERFARCMGLLAEFSLSFDILTTHEFLGHAITLAERFPANRFVLDHIGKPDFRSADQAAWERGIEILGGMDHVYCKLSGLVSRTEDVQLRLSDFTPRMDAVLHHFTPRRTMFGSDWPVCTAARSYAEFHAIIESGIRHLSDHERERIMGLTACDFYNLTL